MAMRFLAGFTLAVLTLGCNNGPRTYPVSGTVVFSNGKPATFGIIEFTPVDSGPGARAAIAADGSFTLKTGDHDGAVAGKHRIAIIQLFARDGVDPKARHHMHASRLVHAKHARFETSELERTVEPKQNHF